MGDRTLSMMATSIPSEPMVGDDEKWEHDSWNIVLTFQGRSMGVKFHTGSGHRPNTPTIGDVLSSLSSDVSTVIDSRGFEDWAGDLGYDTDSRKAERTYNAVLAQVDELRELLGDDFLDVLAFRAPNDGDWSEFEGNTIELPELTND